jgi:hypothetical protein
MPFQPEPPRTAMHALLVGTGKITFGETQVVQGIKQIGLADSIVPANADDPFLKRKGHPGIIFKLEEGYVLYAEQRSAN